MNKSELVDFVAKKSELKKVEAERAVNAIFEGIQRALKQGNEVRVIGFGTFSVSQRAATKGRNPRTGAAIQIAASRAAKFRQGQGLKDALNGR